MRAPGVLSWAAGHSRDLLGMSEPASPYTGQRFVPLSTRNRPRRTLSQNYGWHLHPYAELLGPLAALLCQRVLASDVLGTDDTPVTLLTPGEEHGSRTARFWLYRGRHAVPYDVFAFTDSRTRDGPDQFQPFRGTLSGDCYSGYVNIEQVTQGRIKFSACLGHARRYVFDAREQQPVLGSQRWP